MAINHQVVTEEKDLISIYDERFEDTFEVVVDGDGDVLIYEGGEEPVVMSGRAFLEMADAVRSVLVEGEVTGVELLLAY